MKLTVYFFNLFCLSIAVTDLNAQEPKPIELGNVNWLRSYDKALQVSEETKKPILILFQEVPGCATCQKYGQQVLSHPLIVDAIENEFVPLAIFNNHKGEDARILNLYNEPSWNNPVVRITDHQGKDIIERVSGDYSPEVLIANVTLALNASFRKVPAYLNLLLDELSAEKEKPGKTVFSMYCFWSGEAFLGSLDGVIKSEPGFMGSKEVVRVWYDTSVIIHKQLNNAAKTQSMHELEWNNNFRADKEPQYYLRNSPYKALALSDIQKTKINATLAEGKNAEIYLSPTQLKCLSSLKQLDKKSANIILYSEENFGKAWSKMCSIL